MDAFSGLFLVFQKRHAGSACTAKAMQDGTTPVCVNLVKEARTKGTGPVSA